ncbi:hypothetical protein ASG60_10170 [Methylobacterium sp. Leaf469]|uniref:hypothetical protein n=1 Tax=Methylobacterium sp. Leaf100 TaxID=1736252 RepID=UPI000700D4E8|nr:hypothetical protein [Methylobacterium sp. Leaf100]KQP20234.1 hypothetical protein ASF25_10090 [Methylobacterium sp. Leaf100]KQP60734.1 hypothetical protein ASF52_06265 [Methylobacterium sp. Leaf112]KQT90001.1 hypothetical protein ASG60_10170 [Methylobacterium sp. Leaf469]
MPETHGERSHGSHAAAATEAGSVRRPPALAPHVRRHLGHTLRAFYPADPAEPVGERIEALLIRLGKIG